MVCYINTTEIRSNIFFPNKFLTILFVSLNFCILFSQLYIIYLSFFILYVRCDKRYIFISFNLNYLDSWILSRRNNISLYYYMSVRVFNTNSHYKYDNLFHWNFIGIFLYKVINICNI